MIQNLIFKIIKIYQKFISVYLGGNCRFYPCCSEYSILVIKKYGILKGLILSFFRLLRCNPFNKGGVDIP